MPNRPGERGPDVPEFGLHPPNLALNIGQPLEAAICWLSPGVPDTLGKRYEMVRVRVPDGWFLATCVQLLLTVFPDCFQHDKASFAIWAVGLADQTLVDERGNPGERVVEGSIRIANGRNRIEAEPSVKHGQSLKEPLLIGGQQIVAPGDC